MHNSQDHTRIALGSQLIRCPAVLTLGVYPNLEDYPGWKLQKILNASKIYFPTLLFADLFQIMGKEIFPSVNTYRFLGDKIKQTLLFKLQGLPVPRTRFYYGPKQQQSITKDFSFPFVAKKARTSSMGHGVWLIQNPKELKNYLADNQPAYIQEFLSVDDDYRVVVLGSEVIHAYRRIPARGSFKANISQGGTVCLDNIPRGVLELGLRAAVSCGFDLSGIDICQSRDRLYLLEANMKFGTKGFHCAGLSYRAILEQKVSEGKV
ncbi:ATP-grasp domain-containing protein [Desulfonatronospira sp.]|uniref:ATP-grasp domain-containing protein n=1 Tax=Desulfonatronospira sp. TaxID=1962951 RepID=UPI0025C27CE5|nr:ATP-grasp domain-containing protein [Desulfonatronospira sp.]